MNQSNTAGSQMAPNSKFTVQQIQLQSLIDSGLVPKWRLDFATSIAGTPASRLSPKQVEWVTKIIEQVLAEAEKAPTPKLDVTKIFSMFETAKKHLKFPKVRLIFNMATKDSIKFGINSPNSRYPGSLSMVVDGYGYIGCVGLDGTLNLNRTGSPLEGAVVALLTEFAKDPQALASEHGKMLSSCCFCHLKLSTPESLAMGYGPDCAKHFGLAWGHQKISDAEILEL